MPEQEHNGLTKIGEPQYEETIEEPCHGCGVVQEMEVWTQQYENHPDSHITHGECPVCGNDHQANPPW